MSTCPRMAERLDLINRHLTLFFLWNCFALPKLLFLLCSAPCHSFRDYLSDIDNTIWHCTDPICNVSFDSTDWQQAKLPVRFRGGFGLCSALELALLAYLSSVFYNRYYMEWTRCGPGTEVSPNLLDLWQLCYLPYMDVQHNWDDASQPLSKLRKN